jgi:hypothetical protein
MLRRPFGDGLVGPFFRTGSAFVGQFLTVRFPAGFCELLVDQQASEFFI